MIDREGQVRARYDKIHLFDVDLPTGETGANRGLFGGRGRGAGQWHAGREARPHDLLRPEISDAVRTHRGGRRRRDFRPRRLHGPDRPRPLACASCARARSRRGCSWSPPRRSGATRTGGRHLGTRLSSIRGARSARHGRGDGVGFADIDLARISDVRSRIPALNHRRLIPEPVSHDRLRSSVPRRRRDLRSLVPLERGL